MDDRAESIARDVAAIGELSSVPSLLQVICENTQMGFAAVARVTDGTWTACAVQDNIGFGLKPGGQLEVNTTLCKESRAACKPIAFDHASQDPAFRDHHTPRMYKIESYISVPIVLRDGTYFGNLCAIDPSPRRISEPRIVTMFSLFADLIALELESIERQRVADAALLDANETAELREQYIAVLGHDLRSPLSTISTGAALLAMRPEADLQQLARRFTTSVKRMTRLIEDVMDFTRARLGAGLGLHFATVGDLKAALEEVVSELQEAHPSHSISSQFDIARPVHCDRSRIQQMLTNLLRNALHHGAADQPVVVRAWTDADAFSVSVQNGGNPIAPENLQKVFQPYWRPSSSNKGGGLGLGLHICSQIVSEHGGTLQVTSTADAGTRFIASFPVLPPGT